MRPPPIPCSVRVIENLSVWQDSWPEAKSITKPPDFQLRFGIRRGLCRAATIFSDELSLRPVLACRCRPRSPLQQFLMSWRWGVLIFIIAWLSNEFAFVTQKTRHPYGKKQRGGRNPSSSRKRRASRNLRYALLILACRYKIVLVVTTVAAPHLKDVMTLALAMDVRRKISVPLAASPHRRVVQKWSPLREDNCSSSSTGGSPWVTSVLIQNLPYPTKSVGVFHKSFQQHCSVRWDGV